MKTAKLFSDGGARGNPGPAAIGAVLMSEAKILGEISKYIGETTNNQAEYQALLAGLSLALEHGIDHLNCYLDSELVVKQMRQEYKVKDKELQKIFVKVWNESLKFKQITYQHIPREQNKEADRLVNLALDKKP
jgi:ribonuclease HI